MFSPNFSKLVNYESKLPNFIKVKIGKSKDGGFYVEIVNLPGCFTQADNGEELFVMINDAVYTYFDISKEYFSLLPRYFPIEKLKKQIQTWDKCNPVKISQQPITFFKFQGSAR